VRTVAIAIAQTRSRYADVAVVTPERLRRTAGTGAFLVGAIGTVGTAVANEEPADAASGRPALERARRASGSTRAATAIRWITAVAHAVEASRHRIGHSALQVSDAWQAQANGRHDRALVAIRLYRYWKMNEQK